ncbi:MAG: RluA family pseudouridine synthase [Chlorobi bacterium]|nr:RluA family pseudouridine synthase [Chlorobiota bacterium]
MEPLRILYEDNHLIAVNKSPADLVQSDKTGDASLDEVVKSYIKKKYNKPGDVFLGVIHRLDRPVSGIVLYARTSKALSRMNELFRNREINKKYWAIVEGKPPAEEETLEHFLVRNRQQNKSYAYNKQVKGSKLAQLHYRLTGRGQKYYFLEIDLLTGRHHQIRAQLARIGCVIKGDLKYGAARSNNDGGISLHARSICFKHPVKKEEMVITAEPPSESLWELFVPGNII